MTTTETVIAGIHVCLETYTEDGEGRSSCTLRKEREGNSYGASLALAEDTGGLPYEDGPGDDSLPTNAYGEEHFPLTEHTLARITKWAEANGY